MMIKNNDDKNLNYLYNSVWGLTGSILHAR